MRTLLCVTFLALAGCGSSIGDSCTHSSDCSDEGTRTCDLTSPNGYCTVEGCAYGTCPDHSVCVRFFPVSQLTTPCATDDDCTLAEVCATGKCAPRDTESRFCMATCGKHSDCRTSYECRDASRSAAHGGEPVPREDGTAVDKEFCAPSHPCRSDDDCDLGDTCDTSEGTCAP